MPHPNPEPAIAVLAVVHSDGRTPTHHFVEAPGQDADPYHRAVEKLQAVRREDPQMTHTLAINERALDLATVTMMHSAGFTNCTLIDAEQTRRAIDEMEAQR